MYPRVVFREASAQNERYTTDDNLITIVPLLYICVDQLMHTINTFGPHSESLFVYSVLFYFIFSFCLFGLLHWTNAYTIHLMMCGLWQLSIVYVTSSVEWSLAPTAEFIERGKNITHLSTIRLLTKTAYTLLFWIVWIISKFLHLITPTQIHTTSVEIIFFNLDLTIYW